MGRKDTVVELKKQISLFDAVSISVGTMIGSGIFVSPVGILVNVQSVGMSCILWVVCGVYSALCALCFAELGAAIPSSGGEYIYIHRAFGDFPAFLCLWTSLILNYCAGYAALCLIFSTYILQPIYKDCVEIPTELLRIFSILAYTLIITINCIDVKWVTKLQIVITASKLVALVTIIVFGFIWLWKGKTDQFDNAFDGSNYSPGSIVLAFYAGIWSFSGWSNICVLGGEIIKPQRNIPLAVVISLSTVTIVYLAANIAYFAVLTPREMLKSTAVAMTFAEFTMGSASILMPVLIAVSVFGTLNGSSMAFSRLLYTGSKMNHIPRLLSMLHINRHTPVPAIVFTCVVVLLMLNFDGIFYLIEMSGLSCAAVTSSTIAALLYLRYKEPHLHRPFKLHLSIPIIIFIVSTILVVITFYQKPVESCLALLIISIGMPLYIIGPLWTRRPPAIQRKFDCVTKFLQMLMLVVPEEKES